MRLPCAGILIAVASLSMPVAESAPPACSSPAYSQFDFWVGAWGVTDRNTGKVAGSNRIEKILGGCALMESWTSASGHRGTSLTFYDAARDRWHQTWIDAGGEPLYLDGRLVKGAMTLEGVTPDAKGGPQVRHRVTWSPLPEGRVRQHWESSQDDGATWSDVFDGIYAPTR